MCVDGDEPPSLSRDLVTYGLLVLIIGRVYHLMSTQALQRAPGNLIFFLGQKRGGEKKLNLKKMTNKNKIARETKRGLERETGLCGLSRLPTASLVNATWML